MGDLQRILIKFSSQKLLKFHYQKLQKYGANGLKIIQKIKKSGKFLQKIKITKFDFCLKIFYCNFVAKKTCKNQFFLYTTLITQSFKKQLSTTHSRWFLIEVKLSSTSTELNGSLKPFPVNFK